MNFKILNSLSASDIRSDVLTIGTHNGIFHSDEVVACAILYLHSNMSVQILRSRDTDMLKCCDICVDIGGGKYDHHQAGFNQTRNNGIKYASAGLIWKHFGDQLINKLVSKYFPDNTCDTNSIFELFDNSIICPVDCEDNGISTEKNCLKFISTFLPLWFNNSASDFNNQFHKVLTITISILEEELKTMIGKEIAKNIIVSNWSNEKYFNNGILEIPSQTIDWVETVINLNDSTTTSKQINFVIFAYPSGGWAAQCVPPSLANKFGQRIAFPRKWAGQTHKLPEISGIEDATFCHNGRFFARANSKESIIKMCHIATITK